MHFASAVSHGAKRVTDKTDDVSLDDVLKYEHDVFKTLWGGPGLSKKLSRRTSDGKKDQFLKFYSVTTCCSAPKAL